MWRLGSDSHMEMAVFADPPLASPVAEGIMSADINRADMTTVGLFDDMPDNWRDNPQASAACCVVQNRPRALREIPGQRHGPCTDRGDRPGAGLQSGVGMRGDC